MNLDDGAVDHRHFHIGFLGQGIENALKHPSKAPVPEPAVDRVPLAELSRKVTPLRPGSRDPEHPLQKQSRITPRPSKVGLLAQTVRLDLQPLAIRDDVTINRHPNLPFGKFESEIIPKGNPESQQTLEHTGGLSLFISMLCEQQKRHV